MSSALLETVGDDAIYDALQASLLTDLQAPTPDSIFSIEDLSNDDNASFVQYPPIASTQTASFSTSRPTRPLIITSSAVSLLPRPPRRVNQASTQLNTSELKKRGGRPKGSLNVKPSKKRQLEIDAAAAAITNSELCNNYELLG